jgi:OOP family OmpA-OmpF porin
MSTEPVAGRATDEHTDPVGERQAQIRQAEDELSRLHTLLFPEREHWAGLARRLDDPAVRAAETAEVLPESVRQALARGPGLATTIAPVVEDAIHTSVRHDPGKLVDAIFPVMGPAIRRSITATLRDMIQSLNHMLETSVSWRGLVWRLEARRTGKPFAEVFLLHTLVYQVQQVFLIHRETGLLLHHVVAQSLGLPDPSIVSGMMTAIQDFVNESFNTGDAGTLHTMQVGDLTVWIEPGPHAYVAAIVRGHAPVDLRVALQESLARIHGEFGALLEQFSGDAAPYEACRPTLEACLQSQSSDRQHRVMSWPLGVAVAAIVLVLGGWLYTSIRDGRQWERYVDRLRREPGLVLVTAEHRGGRYVVSGLRDSLAADPARLLAEVGYAPADVSARWEPYYAADPAFVLARAAALLKPPATTRLECLAGVLTLSGSAPRTWMVEQLKLAPFVPGVTSVRADGLRVQEVVDAEAGAARVNAHRLYFAPESIVLDEAARQELDVVATDIRTLLLAAPRAPFTVAIAVTGRTDDTGTETINVKLAARRAEVTVDALVAAGLPRSLFAASGAPASAEAPTEASQRAQLRCVEFQVKLTALSGTDASGPS